MNDTEILDWLEAHKDCPLRVMRHKGKWMCWIAGDVNWYASIREAVIAAKNRNVEGIR